MARAWRRNAWVLPISAVMLAVIMISVPPHLKPEAIALNKNRPGLDFGLAVAHILLATAAIVTVCLNIWPWLRIRQPAAHRWSGRVYVFTALSSSLLTLPLVVLNDTWQGDVGAAATGGFWFVTTLLGYVAIRRGDQVRHRRWMLYSFAMATTVVWGVVLGPFLADPRLFPYLVEVIRWGGPLLNLSAVKWWLDRTARPAATEIPFPTAPRLVPTDRLAA